MQHTQAVTISTASDFLTPQERGFVDDFAQSIVERAKRTNQRIRAALITPIPPDVVERSRGMLTKPLVLAALHVKLTDLANEQDLSPERIVKEHQHIAFANMADFFHMENGFPSIDLDRIPRELMAAVKEMEASVQFGGVKVKIKLYDKQSSLAELGKHTGITKPGNPYWLDHADVPQLTEDMSSEAVAEAYSRFLEQGAAHA